MLASFQLHIGMRKCYRSFMNEDTNGYLFVSAAVVSACAVAMPLL